MSCSASHPSLIDVWVSLWLLLIQRNQEKSEVVVNQKKKIVDKARVISTYKIQTIESWDGSRHFRWLKWELPIFTLWSEVTQWASYRIHFKKIIPPTTEEDILEKCIVQAGNYVSSGLFPRAGQKCHLLHLTALPVMVSCWSSWLARPWEKCNDSKVSALTEEEFWTESQGTIII